MAEKIRALILGGEEFYVQKRRRQLETYLDYKHIPADSGKFKFDVSKYSVVIIVANWVKGSNAQKCREACSAANVPVVGVTTLGQIIPRLSEYKQFAHLAHLAGKTEAVLDDNPNGADTPKEVHTTTGLDPKELWKLYGAKLVETVKALLKPGEVESGDTLFAALSDYVGIPADDVKALLPELGIRGILTESGRGRWRRVDPDAPDAEVARIHEDTPEEAGYRNHGSHLAGLMRGLPPGPYSSVNAVGSEFMKYKEYAKHNGERPTRSYAGMIARKAESLGYIEKINDKIFVKHDPSIKLTPLQVNGKHGKKEETPATPQAAEIQPAAEESSKPRYTSLSDALGKAQTGPPKPKDLIGRIERIEILPGTVKRLKSLIPVKHWDECARKSIDIRAKTAHIVERPTKVDFSEDEWDMLAWETLRKLTLAVVAPIMKEVYEDERILCFDCGEAFIFTKSWQEDLYARFGDEFVKPKRCARCKREKTYDAQDKIESRWNQ